MLRRVLLLLALAVAPMPALAQDIAGDFDFYVLSLSWSPSYCEAEGRDADRTQCASGRPFGFVVHGLWPQYEDGYPEYCDSGEPAPTRGEVDDILDVIPSPGLVRHQWRKHGSCTGLDGGAYLDLTREAREAVRIPPALTRLTSYVTVDPFEVEDGFLAANPELEADGIAVTCDNRRLREVRLCLTTDLDFRSCPEVDARSCRRDRVVMPPVR